MPLKGRRGILLLIIVLSIVVSYVYFGQIIEVPLPALSIPKWKPTDDQIVIKSRQTKENTQPEGDTTTSEKYRTQTLSSLTGTGTHITNVTLEKGNVKNIIVQSTEALAHNRDDIVCSLDSTGDALYKTPYERADRLRQVCSSCYNESIVTDLKAPRYCRELGGYGSFMLNTELFFSVPNKCASQYMNQLTFALMELPPDIIKKGTHVYSYRSAVQREQRKFIPSQYQAMCQHAEKVLVVRHPIMRIISAWNDKFNLNNTETRVGLPMGMRMLLNPSMRNAFPTDVKFLFREMKSAQKPCVSEFYRSKIRNRKLSKVCMPKLPRTYRANPWHLIAFKDFIQFLVKRQPTKVDPHFSPIASAMRSPVTRNPCHFNYTAIIKIQHMKSELNFIFEQNKNFKIPSDFDDIRHSSVGGLNLLKDQDVIQGRVDALFEDIDIDLRRKLKKFYERDFILFEYKWDILTNKLFD